MIPFGTTHAYRAYVWDYTPPSTPPPRALNNLTNVKRFVGVKRLGYANTVQC